MSDDGRVLYECPKCGARLRGAPGRDRTRSRCPGCQETVTLALPLEDGSDEFELPEREGPERRRINGWSRNANVASMVVWVLALVLGFLSRGTDALPVFSLVGFAMALPVCGVHLYVAWARASRRTDHILMAIGTFFLTFGAMALGRGEF